MRSLSNVVALRPESSEGVNVAHHARTNKATDRSAKSTISDEAVRRLRFSLRLQGCPWDIDPEGLEMWLIFTGMRETILDECRRIRALGG